MRRNSGIDAVVLARSAGRGAALVPIALSLLLLPVACSGVSDGMTAAGVTGTGGGAGGATSGTGGATSGTGGGTSEHEHHAMCGMPYDPDPRDATMTGEFIRVDTDKGDEADPSDDKYDLRLPTEMYDWLKEQNWIQEHGDWHNVRRWDQGCKLSGSSDGSCPSADAMKARGLSRAPIQEGAPGDGYAFLVMHRHMIRGFKEAFPKHAALLDGFKKVPLTRDDPENPLPWVDIHWSDDQLAAVNLLQDIEHNLDRFESEDDLGTWIQLGAGGFPGGGFPGGGFPGGGFPGGGFPGGGFPSGASSSSTTATSSTTTSSSAGSGGDGGGAGGAGGSGAGGESTGSNRPPGGIHGALHGQWAVPNSPFSLINNDVNLPLVSFWRLHGWIDDMWERYRVAKGIGEDDPTYTAEMMAQCEDMHELGKATPPTSTTGPLFPPETGVFAEKVAPIFNTYCMGCHGTVAASNGLVLSDPAPSKVRAGLVGVKSSEVEMPIVDPGSPSTSWLIHKLTGDFTGITCNECTTAMPPAGVKPTDEQIETIRAWIQAGATAK